MIKFPFDSSTFTTIYADPPWPEYGGGKIKRGADRHYSLMKVTDIADMGDEVERVTSSNSHLYLWTTNNFLPSALLVMAHWGYEYKTIITWAKDRIGLGQYYRGMTEHCLFGVRGNIPYKLTDEGKRAQGRTLLRVNMDDLDNVHSRKPIQMRRMIELVSPPDYLELFARDLNEPKWTGWGKENG
ncbi:hypothetical protein LCGC14_2728710 [marine sediment metagenome]|uniref:DNA methylase N-4/N-6 domain-containing protein n=1 Tax=marine sediment metagenome TaxID=412755 RepID=A0A0F9BZP9_9ZZZZ